VEKEKPKEKQEDPIGNPKGKLEKHELKGFYFYLIILNRNRYIYIVVN
jgi:hypothetical protein